MNNTSFSLNSEITAKLLHTARLRGTPFDVTITGFSMNPLFSENDIVTIKPMDNYKVGDILVFYYIGEVPLVHRLLAVNDGVFVCKGDNAFRVEEITEDKIIGKVIALNGDPIPPCPTKLVALSMEVNRAFHKMGRIIKETRKTDIYKLYQKIYLTKGSVDIMVYQKNSEMEHTNFDEVSLCVFDPESGDTHLFDLQGINILSQLDEPRDIDTIVARLCEIYDAPSEIIKNDVEAFLAEAVEKKVVVLL